MTKSAIEIEVEGMEQVQRKLEQVARDLRGGPVLSAMREATLLVSRGAKAFAPVDTGRLRASIIPEVVQHAEVVQGIVGSNVSYAGYQELGTKYMPGKRYLRRAYERYKGYIKSIIEKAVAQIVNK